ncbi:MAG: hypothetical protein JWQ87_4077 [Candidatus Sulfotelmatobacter sp.]|nr:hypothetical protein [Candidatus Sulfotelmatobacter sp.]
MNGSRSEAFTKRRTPCRSPSARTRQGVSITRGSTVATPLNVHLCPNRQGVLRLRGPLRFANHPTALSMTDAISIRSHCPEFLGLSFPKMLLTGVPKSCHPERSEWFAKRSIHEAKDPVPLALGTDPSGSSHYAPQHRGNSFTRQSLCMQARGASTSCVASLREPSHSAQHDRSLLQSGLWNQVFVSSFPKMPIICFERKFSARIVTSNLAFHSLSVQS